MRLTTHRDLDVYNMAFEAAMRIFHLLGKLVTMIQHPEHWVIRR